ncbi:MAG TPA: hypothetical protein VMY99_01950 [Nevskiaceae bacterium]|nr:hypothetical protein [Nevskiaceae bacterium]
MPAPTFVASYTVASYLTTTTPKTASVTTQAGDVVVIYAGTEDQFSSLTTPTGNGLTFALQQTVAVASFSTAYIWTAIDNVGGTNWTLSIDVVNSQEWGFTCLVFRDSDGIGLSTRTNVTGPAAPSLDIVTTQDNSAIITYNADWSASDGTSRTWRTVNSITPTNGNGLELNYERDAAHYTIYGAYYNDAGTAGTKTVGLSAPATQKYTIVAVEVRGKTTPAPNVTTRAVTDVDATTATGNGTVDADGGSTITERGVCWSTSPNPTTADSKATTSGTTGDYSVSITGLSSDTLYHARAYAINAFGTSYGVDVTFKHYPTSLSWLDP